MNLITKRYDELAEDYTFYKTVEKIADEMDIEYEVVLKIVLDYVGTDAE